MKIKCPACSKVLSIPESAAGKVVKCPCGKQLRAPAPSAAGAASPPSAPRAAAAVPRPAAPGSSAAPRAASAPSFDPGFFDELTESDLQPVKAVSKPGKSEIRDTSAGAKLLNQYAPGSAAPATARNHKPISQMTLATPGSRILATLIDWAMYLTFGAIGVGVSIAVALAFRDPTIDQPNLEFAIDIIIRIASWIGVLINVLLISGSGQTVGKKVMKIRIVNRDSGAPASFNDGVFWRNGIFGLISIIPFVGLVDLVFLFLEGHETLHDKLAHTIVMRADD
jgi:uncharacterized RDD family membrane protein YckC